MLKQKRSTFFALFSRLYPYQNDSMDIERAQSLEAVLAPSEIIVWETRASHHFAWADHDQMEPRGLMGLQPNSITGQISFYIFGGLCILCAVLVGFYLLISNILAFAETQNIESVFSSIGMMIFAITLIATLPLLLTPYVNIQRAKKIRYIITTRRALILREGPVWSTIWIKTPIIMCICLLLIYTISFFSLIFLFSSSQDYITLVGLKIGSTKFFALLFAGLIGFVIAVIGWVGLIYQGLKIKKTIENNSTVFIRNFYLNNIKKLELPIISRIRKNGVGDIILGSDSHFDHNIKMSSVGFLSIANANDVAKKIHAALTTL
jgi:hypothetical protein